VGPTSKCQTHIHEKGIYGQHRRGGLSRGRVLRRVSRGALSGCGLVEGVSGRAVAGYVSRCGLGEGVSGRVSQDRGVGEGVSGSGCRRAGRGVAGQGWAALCKKRVPSERRGRGKTARACADAGQKREPQTEPGLLLMSGGVTVVLPRKLSCFVNIQ
jgi:hypothetical protein